jgi:serine-type D-Ala-D-Ala carboxypeptidase (penicillin-binding protein 5/6)
MKKFAISALMAVIIASFLASPALASALPDTTAQPLSTASPRDWTKYAPNGDLVPDKIAADSAILIDATTGKVLFAKDEDAIRYPASTTKIMTCLLALENCKDIKNTKVTIGTLPAADLAKDSDHVGFKKGEILTMEQLLYCLMVKSANDAADAIAINIAGSIDKFVEMMNAKALELGMANTHYKDTNGLADDVEHCTTASDMAKLAVAAMKEPNFATIVNTAHYTLAATNMYSKPRSFDSTNYLIRDDQPTYSYVYAKGIKTGFTTMAGNALVASAKRGDVSLISVVLHDVKPRTDGQKPRVNLWVDSITMFEYGFKYYNTVDLLQLLGNESFSLNVKNANSSDPGQGKISLLLKPRSAKAYITDREDLITNLKADPDSIVKSEVTYTKETAPIKRNEVVGTVTYSYNDAPILVCNLLAARDVEEMPTPAPSVSAVASASTVESLAPGTSPAAIKPETIKDGGFGSILLWLGIVALLLVIVAVTIRFVNKRRRKSKRNQYNYRQGNGAKLRR